MFRESATKRRARLAAWCKPFPNLAITDASSQAADEAVELLAEQLEPDGFQRIVDLFDKASFRFAQA